MTPRDQQIARRIKAIVKGVDPDAEVIIFGSRARGQAHAESDWDLLVLTEGEVGLAGEQAFRHALLDLELEIGEVITVFAKSRSQYRDRIGWVPLMERLRRRGCGCEGDRSRTIIAWAMELYFAG